MGLSEGLSALTILRDNGIGHKGRDRRNNEFVEKGGKRKRTEPGARRGNARYWPVRIGHPKICSR